MYILLYLVIFSTIACDVNAPMCLHSYSACAKVFPCALRCVNVRLHCLLQDLHRTGCSSYCGQEAEQDRVVLKRVLLAYARWNKTVGYCQGFNVLAALILEVTEGNEGDALKVCINVSE